MLLYEHPDGDVSLAGGAREIYKLSMILGTQKKSQDVEKVECTGCSPISTICVIAPDERSMNTTLPIIV